jgi:hypothetical protein
VFSGNKARSEWVGVFLRSYFRIGGLFLLVSNVLDVEEAEMA